MQPKLKRTELDRIAEFYSLDSGGVETLLEVTDARPTSRATRQFFSHMLLIGGLLSLAAAIVFFVAANWSAIAVFGRFALLELVFAGCIVLAVMRPPPAGAGRAALFLAFVICGALLALFGQTYQTGADVYELFLTWALLGLPLAWLANWSVSSAAWLLVLNTALALFCGWQPAGGMLWAAFGGHHFQTPQLVMGVAWLNVALWIVFEILELEAVPQWVRRVAIACGFAFGCWAGVVDVLDRQDSGGAMLALIAAMALVFYLAHRRRSDIFPIAMVMGTFIVVSITWLAKVIKFEDESVLLFLALWLIGTSTVAGRMLTITARRWRAENAA